MPPELSRITSFNLDVEDWYSCHTSDDEAYQDALERNSVASWYTARGAASVTASMAVTSIGCGSPSRLADADQALAEMVPEPVGDARPQHDPPELDEADAPLLKRTRSIISAGPLPSAYSPVTSSTPITKIKTGARQQLWPRRATQQPPSLLRAVATATSSAAVTPTTAGLLRVAISVLPDSTSVRLQLTPTIFRFGDVPLPLSATAAGSTDYSAVLMGPEGDLATDKSDLDLESTTPKAVPASKLDADCAVKLLTRPRGTTPYKSGSEEAKDFASGGRDPSTPKDQNKAKRQAAAEGKVDNRKASGSGFPGGFIQRLFSGLRNSNRSNGAGASSSSQAVPPATVQELGSELLKASAATTVAEIAGAAQLVPMVAGYVQAAAPAVPGGGPVVAAPAEPVAVLDEATAAAQRLSAEIFRNVLRASGGGAATPKPVLSPRDTAFPPPESRTSQRDQIALSVAAAAAPAAAEEVGSPQQQQPQSPGGGEAALALLVGLAADASVAAVAVPVKEKTSVTGAESEEGGLLTPNLSVDCGGLPMPKLEQCDSPVTVGPPTVSNPADEDADEYETDGAAEPTSADAESTEEAATAEVAEPAGVAGNPAERAVAAAEPDASASPRTVSKRAYGTVARLVRKMTPNFRDSTMMSSNSMQQGSMTAGSAADAGAAADAEPEAVAGEVTRVVEIKEEDSAAATVEPEKSDPEAAPAQEAVAEPSAGEAAPALFVFGQEKPKSAKKARSFSSKAAGSAAANNDDAATPSEVAGRKRKGDDEILPSAKVPVVAERTESAKSDKAGLSPVPSSEQPSATNPPLTNADSAAATAPPAADSQPTAAGPSPAEAPAAEPAQLQAAEDETAAVAPVADAEPAHEAVPPPAAAEVAVQEEAVEEADVEPTIVETPAAEVPAAAAEQKPVPVASSTEVAVAPEVPAAAEAAAPPAAAAPAASAAASSASSSTSTSTTVSPSSSVKVPPAVAAHVQDAAASAEAEARGSDPKAAAKEIEAVQTGGEAAPEASEQIAEEKLSERPSPDAQPAEGGKHKRRGSFLCCFRA